MMCVTMEIRSSIRKRSTCWLSYVWIENSYNTCVKSTPSWVVRISMEHSYRWPWVRNLTHFKLWKVILKESIVLLNLSWNFAHFRRLKIVWIPGTYILLIINNFTGTFCDVDDWIFHTLSLWLFPFSVYYLCRFVTVCTVKKMWAGGYVTVIFHILCIRKHCF